MSKHTPEPWPTFIDCCEPSTPVPDSEPIVRLGFDDYNMARACVNACKGMAKSDLDNMVMMGETLLDRFGMFHGEIAELKRQRDELLGLIKAVSYHSTPVTVDGIKCAAFPWAEFESMVAKAKGSAS